MRHRRSLLLAAVLAVLTVLLLVPQGFALLQPRITLSSLFGPNMMRADVTMASGVEWRVDRGIVVTNTPSLLTLHETDGRVQAIVVASTTKVFDPTGNRVALSTIKPGWRVLVIWPALGGSAYSVKIEKRSTTS